jgi:phospholipid/cholesterol/gamma-HCH transport system substrate-binding protein
MKISNETKIGALTSIAIVFLILGFNFLKGKSFSTKEMHLYARFENISGLAVSNPVIINGKQIGIITATDGGNDMRQIVVSIKTNQELLIPDNSVAAITPSILGITSLEIKLGNNKTFFKDQDTIKTIDGKDMIEEAFQKFDPVLFEVKQAVSSLDSVLSSVNSIFDQSTKQHIKAMMENLDKTTASLNVSSTYLQDALNPQSGDISQTIKNLNSVTGNMAKNNTNISQTITNLNNASGKLAGLDLQTTLTNLNESLASMKSTLAKINSENGTIGELMNNKTLYNNLNATSNKINLLLDDIRIHPKRYVNVSVFGRKDKVEPLTTPLPDTMNAPYIHP